MATDKQIEANRSNSTKSTGPRTDAGKTQSARNGRRFNALAESILLQSENSSRFFNFARRLNLEYQPQGPTERTLLDMMITARWRLLRLVNLEAASVDQEYDLLRDQGTAFAGSPESLIPRRASQAFRNICAQSRSLNVLNSMESRLQRQFDSALDRLTLRIAVRKTDAKPIKFPPLS